jgi:uncharacterized protein (TIGR03435 family)
MKKPSHNSASRGNPWIIAALVATIALPATVSVAGNPPNRAIGAQNSSSAQFTYDVATIRPTKSTEQYAVKFSYTPDGLTAENVSLQLLIRRAFGLQDDQILNAPGWLNSEKYDLDAKMDSATADAMNKLTGDQRTQQRKLMLQALLIDRIVLKTHPGMKDLQAYSLLIGKNGAKLHESQSTDPSVANSTGMNVQVSGQSMTISGQGIPMAPLLTMLSQELNRPVLDKTGLTGTYNFSLQFTMESAQFQSGGGGAPGGQSAMPAPDAGGVSIFTALQEQLGLKLESGKGPVDVLVIDHVERPTGN